MHGRRPFRGRGVGHRWYEPERVLERLEEYQRDLEQETADVADLLRRLKEEKPAEAVSL
jgi:ADP-dependent phosphofructokinase/glucokinase